MTAEPVDVVKEFCDAWGSCDAGRLAALMASDAVFHNIPIDPLVGRDAIQVAFETFLSMAQNVHFEVRNLAGAGSVVFAERVDHFDIGTAHVDLPCNGVFEVVDGKIAAWRDYFDVATFTQQASMSEDDDHKLSEAYGG